MMVRFEEDEYIAVAIFDAGDRIQTMNAMDEIFSYLDEDMKYLIFTTIQKLYYLSDEGYKELERTVEIYKADLEVESVCSLSVKKEAGIEKPSFPYL